MKIKRNSRITQFLCTTICAAAFSLTASVRASDHADSPTVAGDQAADLADLYAFLDPNDSEQLVIINTVRGFIVPGEAGNFGIFDSNIKYRLLIENTGPVDAKGKPLPTPGPLDLNFDAKPDAYIDVEFTEKNSADPQTATVTFGGSAFAGIAKGKYVGTATAAGLGATPPGGDNYFPPTPQKLKAAPKGKDGTPGAEIDIEFFAGEADDPFFFDIPGFVRFRNAFIANLGQVPGTFANRTAALVAAAPQLGRGRDTFAGYNVMVVAFRVPIAELKNKSSKVTNATKFGFSVQALRQTQTASKGVFKGTGSFGTVDREGLPAINALLVPLADKNAYNGGTTLDDANLKFAPGILGTLNALQVQGAVDNPTTPLGLLAKLAVLHGDFLRIETSLPSGFPNGRKPADDVVATLLTVIASTTLTPSPDIPADDSVGANEVPFSANFPYLGLPHQPRANGVTDDATRN